jgi:hypothetical protein
MKRTIRRPKISPREQPEVAQLAELVGEFMEYWGFRKLHGMTWAYLFLAERPLSTLELTQLLQVSKGSMSTVLADLLEHEVIEEAPAQENGMACYRAGSLASDPIVKVLKRREGTLLARVTQSAKKVASKSELGYQAGFLKLRADRAEVIGQWSELAMSLLQLMFSVHGSEKDPFKRAMDGSEPQT